MSEITIEQATQRHGELSFLSKHHEELSKHYLREAILTEQAILAAQQKAAEQVVAVDEETDDSEEVKS